MDKPFKFLLPSPSFDKKPNGGTKAKPHFLTPSGMTLLPREKQPPPMYGQRGATVPAKYLKPVATEDYVPEPVKQYCEPCEVELQSLEDYKRHRAQHEKCPVTGCQYKGHPTVMDKHITSLHNSGLFEKFKKLSSPEEIATWREERRKRFPTVANVLLKQKAQEQRQKRGERLEVTRNRFGKMEDRKRAQPNGEDAKSNVDIKTNDNKLNKNQRNRKKNRNGKRDRKDAKPTKESSVEQTKASPNDIEDEVSRHGLIEFRGTLKMKCYKHVNSKPKTNTQNALFGLVGMYGSDDESEDEPDMKENKTLSEDIEETYLDTEVNYHTIAKGVVEMPQKYDTLQKISHEAENNEKVVLLEDDCKGIINNHEHTDEIYESPTEMTIENIPPVPPTEMPCMLSINIEKHDPSFPSNSPRMQIVDGNSSDDAPEERPIHRSMPEYQINSVKSKPNIAPPSINTLEHAEKHAAKQQPLVNSKAKQILKRKSGLDYRNLKIRKQNTMLEKLLESDIRHERNVLLQCVRYVCENNFFGVASKPSVG